MLLGAVVGLERERVHRGAGLKTHVLVCVGSALFTIISIQGFNVPGHTNDPARLAAQIVSGIGFLGAGTIMKQGSTIRGLTTAASLWVVAGIGTAAGAGQDVAALIATVIVVVSLYGFKRIERGIGKADIIHLEIRALNTPTRVDEMREVLKGLGVRYSNVRIVLSKRYVKLRLRVDIPPGEFDYAGLARCLNEAGAHHVEWRHMR